MENMILKENSLNSCSQAWLYISAKWHSFVWSMQYITVYHTSTSVFALSAGPRPSAGKNCVGPAHVIILPVRRAGEIFEWMKHTGDAIILSQFRVSRAIIYQPQSGDHVLIDIQTVPMQSTNDLCEQNPLISINQLQISRWFGPMSDNGAAIWHLNLSSDWAFLDQFESQICDNYIVLCLIQRK